ncbi:MAG: nitrite/sulfite reductase [Candidatus Omnitrophica bacterium]|nr:nitrite/sulfite reductase [Candidatus Omnitrophota bacterium]
MAENLLEKRLEEVLQGLPELEKSEIEELRKMIEQYFLGEITPDEFKARRLMQGTYGIRGLSDIQMLRVKVPGGLLNADQLEVLADVADKYSKGISHITTRQDVQLYWIPVKEIPQVTAALARAGLTTREACGNSVRNVTGSPYAGTDPNELFDVTPYVEAVTHHFLRHPASQKLPRKFKMAFEGSPADHARTSIHDIGGVAAIQDVNGKAVRGFRLYCGGGLGTVPRQAVLLEPFTPVSDLLRTCEAVVRVHDRLGERKNRAAARLKFLVKKMGDEAFRAEVFKERASLDVSKFAAIAEAPEEQAPSAAKEIPELTPDTPVFYRWLQTNVVPQKQDGYSMVLIRLHLGDINSKQARQLAQIVRRFCGGRLRTAISQNLVLRWIRKEHLGALYEALVSAGLADTEAERLLDVTSCPGAETCQLGIAASRGLARALEQALERSGLQGEDLDTIRIKVSGCPNSCGQHHIANIGFLGGSRKIDGRLVPHFQMLLGGQTGEGVAIFGKPTMRFPARRVPGAVQRILELFRQEREAEDESFNRFVERVGKDFWKEKLEEFTTLPSYEEDPSMHRDWGAETDFSLEGMGAGECAA